jgi:hypothetical protein
VVPLARPLTPILDPRPKWRLRHPTTSHHGSAIPGSGCSAQ